LGLFGDKEQAKQEHKSSVSGFAQRFGSPLAQAFPGCFRGGGNRRVDYFGADADKELAGVGLVWPLAKRFTGGQIAVDRFPEIVFQFVSRFSMEADNIPDTDDMADKNVVFGVKLDTIGVAFVCHSVHGFTFNSVRKLRASFYPIPKRGLVWVWTWKA